MLQCMGPQRAEHSLVTEQQLNEVNSVRWPFVLHTSNIGVINICGFLKPVFILLMFFTFNIYTNGHIHYSVKRFFLDFL